MRLLIALVFAVGVLGLQTPEPYPGQTEHKEPPAGWMCHRPEMERIGTYTEEEQAHLCGCERHCDGETQWMHNDEACTVHCHESHCTCPVSGDVKRCMPASQQ